MATLDLTARLLVVVLEPDASVECSQLATSQSALRSDLGSHEGGSKAERERR